MIRRIFVLAATGPARSLLGYIRNEGNNIPAPAALRYALAQRF
jgi:hypothetical protein